MSNVQDRLEYLRGELRAERISYGELAELQDYGEQGLIDESDVELREAAGVPESCECDNTHEQNDTVCRFCWANGRRHWNDPE